jgi:hypothetical protein
MRLRGKLCSYLALAPSASSIKMHYSFIHTNTRSACQVNLQAYLLYASWTVNSAALPFLLEE